MELLILFLYFVTGSLALDCGNEVIQKALWPACMDLLLLLFQLATTNKTDKPFLPTSITFPFICSFICPFNQLSIHSSFVEPFCAPSVILEATFTQSKGLMHGNIPVDIQYCKKEKERTFFRIFLFRIVMIT